MRSNTHTFTYLLGQSLYIPLTSRCNTVTLPSSRGPNFVLPPFVASALCRVRDAEHNTTQWAPWAAYLETQDTSQRLPDPLERVSYLEEDFSRRPSVDELLRETEMIMQEQNNGNCHYNNIVFAGEGEPTLRLASLLQLATSIKQSQQSATTTGTFTMRLVTNGLIDVTHIQSLYDCGISSVSVALMTSQSEQYESLMKPLLLHTQAQTSSQTSLAHERVCAFIRQAVDCGLQVEATATDRKDVDKQATEALATRLGAHTFRWRSFFP